MSLSRISTVQLLAFKKFAFILKALRESESLLGNITENDILGNMEEIDFDNLDLNELLLDGDDDDDDDETLENALSGIV